MESRVRALLIVVCAVVFVNLACASSLSPLLVHYMDSTRLSMSGAGFLVAAFPAGTLAGAIPAGLLSNRFGQRAGVLAGLGLLTAGTLAFAWATVPAALGAARIAQGFGGALAWAAALSWLAGATPAHRRGTLLGTALAAATAGELVGPGLGVLAARLGPGPVFTAVAGSGAILMAVVLSMAPPARSPRQMPSSALGAVRDPAVRAGLTLILLIGIAYGIAEVLVPVRISDLGGAPILTGGIFIACAGLDIVFGPLAGRLYDSRGAGFPVVISLLAGIVLSLAAPAAGRPVLLAIVLVAVLPVFGSLFTPATALLSDGADRLAIDQGVLFGLGDLAWSAGQAGAASTAGVTAQVTSDSVPWLLVAAGCVLGLLWVRRITAAMRPDPAGAAPALTAERAGEEGTGNEGAAAVRLDTGEFTVAEPLARQPATIRRARYLPLSGTETVPRRLLPGDAGSAGIADYQFIAYVGPGSLGGVFRARAPARLPVAGRGVAVKVLGSRTSAEVFARAVTALRAYAAVTEPRLVTIYDVGRDAGVCYYSMDYLAGGSLAGWAGLVSPGMMLRALADAAAAAAALHQSGIVHRGIKPQTILLDGTGGGKLSGPALRYIFLPGAALAGPGSIAALEFADPALLLGAPASAASDVWSLGATIHRVTTGISLLSADLPAGDSLQAIRAVLAARPRISPALPGPLAELVAECIAAPPERPDASQVARRLGEIGTLAPA